MLQLNQLMLLAAHNRKAVVLRHDLQWYGVLHIVQKNGKKFIVEKDTCCIEDVL